MVTGNYKWECTFTSCGATNEISRQWIFDMIAKRKKIALICGNCGYISLGDGSVTPGELDNQFKCVPWGDSIQRQPIGETPSGWVSAQGEEPISAERYRIRWGVDAALNWQWQQRFTRV
jgi:hypothetical protein